MSSELIPHTHINDLTEREFDALVLWLRPLYLDSIKEMVCVALNSMYYASSCHSTPTLRYVDGMFVVVKHFSPRVRSAVHHRTLIGVLNRARIAALVRSAEFTVRGNTSSVVLMCGTQVLTSSINSIRNIPFIKAIGEISNNHDDIRSTNATD